MLVDPLPRLQLAVLFAGDTLVFLLFAVLGSGSHEGLDVAGVVWRTSVPFMAAWFGLGLLLGAFRWQALRPAHLVWLKTALIWLPAGAVGLLLRSLMLDRELIFSFAIVSVAVTGGLLALWRTAFVLTFRAR
jgi:hypothetical protein